MYCPTLCDDDCTALCHEQHQVYWKQSSCDLLGCPVVVAKAERVVLQKRFTDSIQQAAEAIKKTTEQLKKLGLR